MQTLKDEPTLVLVINKYNPVIIYYHYYYYYYYYFIIIIIISSSYRHCQEQDWMVCA